MNRKYPYPLPLAFAKPDATGAGLSCGARMEKPRMKYVFHAVTIALISTMASNAHAQLQGGVVSAGSATINSSAGHTTIDQSTSRAAINWQRFDVNPSESVRFIQPDRHSVALNRVLGSTPSNIMGSLSANGQVFLLNPHGVLFGKEAQVNVGGLVASTLGLSDSDFMAGRYRFSGAGNGSVLNQGSINADGGYVAMLGANVSNEGVISARLGTIALAAGNAVTLDLAGDGLLNVTLNQGVANALVENSGRIAADGGFVLMTTQAAGSALQGVVNNTGVVQAKTIRNRNGKIMLMGDMDSGTVNVAGTLDASAPSGGDGGFIETSAAKVNVADDFFVTTLSEHGSAGTWLIDPKDYTIGADPGDDASPADVTLMLSGGNVEIFSSDGAVEGFGDIHVNAAVTWGTATTLTLNAERDVNVNAAITPTNGSLTLLADRDVNVRDAISVTNGNVVVCCGRDVNVSGTAAITTVNGSIFLGAGRDIEMAGAMTATDGNIAMCAGDDVTISGAMTVTNGSTIPGQSLGLPRGLTILAGLDGTGPGSGSGTVSISSVITNTAAPATIYYNPSSYAGTGVFAGNFVGSAPTEIMWIYPQVEDKVFDGTTTATLTGLRGDLVGIDVGLVGGGTANFNDPNVGSSKTVTFSGFGLTGGAAGNFAFTDAGGGFSFPENCCGNFTARTTGNILSSATPPDEPTSEIPTEGSGGSGAPTPTSTPPPTSTPTPISPAPGPGMTPVPSVPRPLPTLLPTTVPQIVASTLPTVAFSPPTVVPDASPNLSYTGIRMPPPIELVQIEAMQEDLVPAPGVPSSYPTQTAPEVTAPLELSPKPDRN